MAKYLDNAGVSQLWTAVKEQDATNLAAAKNYTDGKDNAMGSRVSALEGYFTSGVANEAAKATKDGNNDTISSTYVKVNTKGQANGVCPLDANAKVAAAYLPGYVDDIIEGYYYQNKFYEESAHTTEIIGEGGKLYVDKSTNTTYRWSGTQFTMVSESISIGTTQGTAYDGAAGATMRSDVDALQTAVTTTIPATYVPISSGTNYGNITNNTSKIDLTYGSTTSGMEFKMNTASIHLGKLKNSSLDTYIMVSDAYITFVGTNLKWKTTPNETAKTVATTEDIASTYVPINGSTSAATEFAGGAGTLYPKISNGSGSVALSSSRKVNDDTTHTSKVNVKAAEVIISSSYVTNSNESKIKVDPSGIYLITTNLYTQTSSSATAKTIATTDQIPSVEAITSQELAAILV